MTTGSSAIGKVYDSDEWKAIMAQNGLAPLDLRGADFQAFVEAVGRRHPGDLSKEIGLIK